MTIGKHVTLGVSSAVALAAAMAFADETAYITSSGSVTVSSGRTVATPKTMQFYRFTITDKYYPGGYDNYTNWKGNTEVGEIALYDAEGNRLNANLTLNKDENDAYTFAAATASASSLAPGTFSVTVPSNVKEIKLPTDNENPEMVFDDGGTSSGTATKAFINVGNDGIKYSDSTRWLRFNMRLADGSAPVAAYNLQFGNDTHSDADGGERTPYSWLIEASYDGETWVTLAEVVNSTYVVDGSGSFVAKSSYWLTGENGTTGAANVTKIPVDTSAYGYDPSSWTTPAGRTQFLVKENATLALGASAQLGSLINLGGTVEIGNAVTGVWVVAEGDVETLPGGGFSGAGALVKRGGGTLEIGGENEDFSGDIAVEAGTLRFLASEAQTSDKFFRIAIKKRQDGENSEGTLEIGEIGLYDADGNQLNLNLAFTNEHASAYDLDPSAMSVGMYTNFWIDNVYTFRPKSDGEGADKVCDGDTTTKGGFGRYQTTGLWPNPDECDTWIVLNMRLADDAASAASYRIASGNDTKNCPHRAPVSWRLESSETGNKNTWKIIAEVDDSPRVVLADSTWYNGGQYFPIAVPTTPASGTAVPSATFSIASGATLDLGGVTAERLAIDCTASAGSITNFSASEVNLVNFGAYRTQQGGGSFSDGIVLPVTIIGDVDEKALRSTAVYIDGVLDEALRLRLDNDALSVRWRDGLTVIVR